MAVSLNRQIRASIQRLQMLSASPALKSPVGYLQQKEKQLELLTNRLVAAQSKNIAQTRQQYISCISKLDAMSPLKVLMRGYSMTQTEDRTLVRSVSQVNPGDVVTISVSDGSFSAAVVEKRSEFNEPAE